jgi:hypothetical protein
MGTESEYKQRDALGYVKVTEAAETSVQARRFSAPDPAGKIADPPLQHRRFLLLRNNGATGTVSTPIYIGDSTVDATNGYPLVSNNVGASYKLERILLDISDNLAVYGKMGALIEEFRTLELA